MDGNRRWAAATGFTNSGAGHRAGARTALELLGWCQRLGIPQVTLWGISLENLTRDPDEVAGLSTAIIATLQELAARDRVRRQDVRIRVLGRRESLPEELREAVERAEAATGERAGMEVQLALGYSGRDELLEACRSAIRELAAQGTAASDLPAALSAELLARHLYTEGRPDPDLIIRTSGEQRLSGFMPWQSAFAEFYFCDVNWPAFREIDFLRAIRSYQARQRRFGR
jgi:short-chain Z-isoprenyl diphosphate synthase